MTTVIIPAFQPDKILISIAEKLWALGYIIVIVDDGSGEEYRNIFEAAGDISIILHHEENRGKGAAIKTALKYIKSELWDSEVIGVMDSDGQHSTKDMRRVIEYAYNHKNALVIGARNVGEKMPLKSRMGNRITRAIFQMVSGVRVTDTQTGLRAFGSEMIKKLLSIDGDRYEYEMNVLIEFAKENISIEEVRVDTIYHDKENSCSHFHIIRDSLRIYKDLLKFTLSSLSGFIVDYMLFALLMLIFPHTELILFLSNVFARIVSAYYNYTLNCSMVISYRQKSENGSRIFCSCICYSCIEQFDSKHICSNAAYFCISCKNINRMYTVYYKLACSEKSYIQWQNMFINNMAYIMLYYIVQLL